MVFDIAADFKHHRGLYQEGARDVCVVDRDDVLGVVGLQTRKADESRCAISAADGVMQLGDDKGAQGRSVVVFVCVRDGWKASL